MKAAVMQQVGDAKLEVRDDVTLASPGPNQVRVKIRAAGVCHSDLSAMTGTLPQPPNSVLGHEGAGEIVEVGSAVTALAVGDHVIVNWAPACGVCTVCVADQPYLCMAYLAEAFTSPPFDIGGTPGFGMAGTGTWTEETILPQQGAIKIDPAIPFDIAALVGCGVMTGAGAAINSAKVKPGSTVVVIGCGGVGISAIQGARVAGARVIVGVDMLDQKLEWARELGATHTAMPDQLDALKAELTSGGMGFDYAFEVVGRSDTMRQAYDAARRGGMVVVIGAGRMDDMVQLSAFELFYNEKTIQPSYYGSAHVTRDFPLLLGLWQAGKLDLEGLISRRIALEDINDAVEALKRGEVLRQIIQFD